MSDLPVSIASLSESSEACVTPSRLLFSSISGSHLYGFSSADSDVDVRGAFVAPLKTVLSMKPRRETIEVNTTIDGVLVESVFHEVEKYFRLLLKGNGYVIEQIVSPLTIVPSTHADTLKRLAPRFMTIKSVLGHYRGFSASQFISGAAPSAQRGEAHPVRFPRPHDGDLGLTNRQGRGESGDP
jgi:predicted nucleotidyltransferase